MKRKLRALLSKHADREACQVFEPAAMRMQSWWKMIISTTIKLRFSQGLPIYQSIRHKETAYGFMKFFYSDKKE